LPLRRLELTGRRIALELTGAAPHRGVVLLHGFGSSRRGVKVRALCDRLEAAGVPWAALDATAHGESTGSVESITLSLLVDDLGACLARLRRREGWVGRIVVVGSSLGGLAAAWTAVERRGSADALLLVAPAMRLVERLIDSLTEAEIAAWRSSGRLPRERRGHRFGLGWELVEDWRRREHGELAARLTLPVTIVHGADDESVPIQDSRALAAAAGPDLRLVEIPGGDHRLHEHVDTLHAELSALLA
jgi:pimeloyl-ACP methyl ester carboxylesterase